MQEYELCVLFGGDQTSEEADETSKTVENLLEQIQAQVKFKHSLNRRKLAYAISEQTHGSYYIWLIQAEPSQIQELNEKLRLSQEVLRYITTKLENITIEEKIKQMQEPKKEPDLEKNEPKPEQQAIEEKISEPEPAKERKEVKKESEKVSLDQLDEKLDELLESDKL